MEGESDLPAEEKFLNPNSSRPININTDSNNLSRSFNTTSTCTSTTSSSSSSPPDLVRQVQAAFKRHRPLGMMQPNVIRPRRILVAQRGTSKESNVKPHSAIDVNKSKEDIPQSHKSRGTVPHSKSSVFVRGENKDDKSNTPPPELGATVNAREENFEPIKSQIDLPRLDDAVASSSVEPENVVDELQRKVDSSVENITTSRGADDRMATAIHDLLSHMDSLALTEIELETGNQVKNSSVDNQGRQHHNFQSMEMDKNVRPEGENSSLLVRTTMGAQDKLNQFGNFLQNDLSNAITQSSVIGSSCITTLMNSKTYSSQPKMDVVQPSSGGVLSNQSAPPSSKVVPSSDVKSENSKPEKLERGTTGKAASTSRSRKGYDPDLFFKVNGKLYQRLGKIGSGGSSEVHKVISSDCTIYALKKIKLKGRDYATAYGFCQEIGYLNRLKGKSNIIQLIDFEVTDKALLQEVMNGSMSNKDGRLKDDAYIYMVLEYGEIDLAHMLSHKWKELDGSDSFIDENWLRFYWQQILLAVSTIHEERIVHSDLKPANFLLVRGSLKLIDFGIAKAIMSDTTNIQRDSQVGTLSYMSPEAFLCNETDANGNTIKCGRPSDIWSLGCILYQMVYGRTPFSEYKTFWSKFKIITDPNHEIIYEPLTNTWLLDLMKKCLAWDRNERWRIPQLLQHPFLVPPLPPKLASPKCTLFQLIAECSANDEKGLNLCSQLQSMVMDPRSLVQFDDSSLLSRNELRKLLCRISTGCFQLQEQLESL
ncbi:hypothetical protein MIMGU_mgv1a023135mg [Erythranthe guttata]|uniref:Protein kinase domain-containing protein n=1 Tax=Erythranthe guttata TaxID=4155 RepID=A0A022Q4K6_ERYGU|nr:hypothetical protein MIMGU_mgv1a023135mg [Erythranthe guttata]